MLYVTQHSNTMIISAVHIRYLQHERHVLDVRCADSRLCRRVSERGSENMRLESAARNM